MEIDTGLLSSYDNALYVDSSVLSSRKGGFQMFWIFYTMSELSF